MEELTQEERIFLKSLTKIKPEKRKGYLYFTFRNKHYKRSRVLMQLHLNKKLEIWECVHHKDKNKSNDELLNLEIIEASDHISLHNAGSRKKRKNCPAHNKIKPEKEQEIYKLCKLHIKKNGFPNYEKVGKLTGLAGQTIRKYYLNLKSS